MFYHIIMKNFKSNLKNYILFFVSNILAIAELFAFWGLNDVVKKAVKDGVTAATLKSDFVLAAGLITFITVFLMIFSMKYYMKLRIKDYTTFIVLGMKKKTSYSIPFMPQNDGSNRMIGTKQIPCRQAPRTNPAVPFPSARNREEYTV